MRTSAVLWILTGLFVLAGLSMLLVQPRQVELSGYLGVARKHASGRIVVSSTLLIAKGEVLMIAPGTEVTFAEGAVIRVVGGALYALGTRKQPIRFRGPSGTAPGGGIITTGSTILQHVEFVGCNGVANAENPEHTRCVIASDGVLSAASVTIRRCSVRCAIWGGAFPLGLSGVTFEAVEATDQLVKVWHPVDPKTSIVSNITLEGRITGPGGKICRAFSGVGEVAGLDTRTLETRVSVESRSISNSRLFRTDVAAAEITDSWLKDSSAEVQSLRSCTALDSTISYNVAYHCSLTDCCFVDAPVEDGSKFRAYSCEFRMTEDDLFGGQYPWFWFGLLGSGQNTLLVRSSNPEFEARVLRHQEAEKSRLSRSGRRQKGYWSGVEYITKVKDGLYLLKTN